MQKWTMTKRAVAETVFVDNDGVKFYELVTLCAELTVVN